MNAARKLLASPPAAFTSDYAKYSDMPADVLAARVMDTLALCRGDVGKCRGVLTTVLQDLDEQRQAARVDDARAIERLQKALTETQRELVDLRARAAAANGSYGGGA